MSSWLFIVCLYVLRDISTFSLLHMSAVWQVRPMGQLGVDPLASFTCFRTGGYWTDARLSHDLWVFSVAVKVKSSALDNPLFCSVLLSRKLPTLAIYRKCALVGQRISESNASKCLTSPARWWQRKRPTQTPSHAWNFVTTTVGALVHFWTVTGSLCNVRLSDITVFRSSNTFCPV